MVQCTKILVAFAVAAAVPALAAPFTYVESREIENIDAREPFWATLRKIVTNGGARRTMITHPLRKIADEQEKQRKADQKRLPPSFIAKNRAILRAWGKQQQPEKPRPLHWKVQAAVRVGHKEKQPFENAHPVHHKRNLEDLLERDPFDLD